jgi:hypothetical protein
MRKKTLPKHKSTTPAFEDARDQLKAAMEPINRKILDQHLTVLAMDLAHAAAVVLQEEFNFTPEQIAQFTRSHVARATKIRVERYGKPEDKPVNGTA